MIVFCSTLEPLFPLELVCMCLCLFSSAVGEHGDMEDVLKVVEIERRISYAAQNVYDLDRLVLGLAEISLLALCS